ncbi:MAG: PilZ domain-containing protein [Nitrospiria bacterium]
MNKRQHVRVPFFGKASVLIEGLPLEVSISNLSMGGLLLHTSESFDLGCELATRLSGKLSGIFFEENVDGRIVAVHKGSAGNSYGIRFKEYLDQEKQPSLYSWVNNHQEKPSPSFLRNTIG